MAPTVGLETVAKWNNPCKCRESNPGRPARSLVTTARILIAVKVPSLARKGKYDDTVCSEMLNILMPPPPKNTKWHVSRRWKTLLNHPSKSRIFDAYFHRLI
jgi:hypothetical protein